MAIYQSILVNLIFSNYKHEIRLAKLKIEILVTGFLNLKHVMKFLYTVEVLVRKNVAYFASHFRELPMTHFVVKHCRPTETIVFLGLDKY